MASRQEEKERRRREREEAQRAAERAASRKRTLQIGGGAVLVLAVIAVIAVVALAGGDDKPDTSNLAADATAAGCTFKSYKSEGRNHTTGKVNYKTNPPTSGSHNPTPAQDGIYAPGNEPQPGSFVHSLEHGRIEFQYKPGTSQADIAKLRKLAEEPINDSAGYHVLMFQNNTNMTSPFAVTAWTKSLTCDKLTPQSLVVMRDFRKAFTDKGPEFIP